LKELATDAQHEIEAFITRVARWRGQDISDCEPLLTVQMPDGSWVRAVCPPVSPGWCFTIRKHMKERWTMEALVENGMIAAALSDFIPASERVVVIEDVSEIRTDLPNLVRFEAQPSTVGRKEITIRSLVKHA
jgi:pilus assembly protein CpaF